MTSRVLSADPLRIGSAWLIGYSRGTDRPRQHVELLDLQGAPALRISGDDAFQDLLAIFRA